MNISQKLQNQITWLCGRISQVEWSGVLFYTTSGGTYGDPDFEITAEEVYLMDINTPAFTQYSFDGNFVGMLMANPHLKKMKKGHIHSHQHMSVFFSGTDTAEILDNSEFHNHYVSLIVNNRNHMIAKIATRIKTMITIEESQISRSISGEEIVTKSSSNENSTTINIYDCELHKPFISAGNFFDRFNIIQAIRDSKNEFEAKQEQQLQRVEMGISQNRHISTVKLKQNDLFADLNYKIKPDTTTFNESTPDSVQLVSFLIDLLGAGVKNQSLNQVLGNLNRRIRTPDEYHTAINRLFSRFFISYEEIYTNEARSSFKNNLRSAVTYLKISYMKQYPFIIERIIKSLETYIN